VQDCCDAQLELLNGFDFALLFRLALVARAGQRRPVAAPTEPSTWIPSSFPRFLMRKDFNQQGWISPEIDGLVM
jgi:hypothetical protein